MNIHDIVFAKDTMNKCLILCQVCTDLKIFPWEHYWSDNELNVLAKLTKDIYYAGKTIISANADLSYVVDSDEIVHCIYSSPWIRQFDGCKESEIKTQ